MPETAKHIPTRKCVACKASKPKKQLLRVVKQQGRIFVDETGKADGRGAYLCSNLNCIRAAVKNRRLEKIFHTQIPAEIYSALEKLSLNMEV